MSIIFIHSTDLRNTFCKKHRDSFQSVNDTSGHAVPFCPHNAVYKKKYIQDIVEQKVKHDTYIQMEYFKLNLPDIKPYMLTGEWKGMFR